MSALHPPSQRGMTLVEMLVVLAIIAIATGGVVLSLGSTGREDVRSEARILAARVQLAADASMTSDRPLALALEPQGYRIIERDEITGQWRPGESGLLADRHRLPDGVTLASSDRTSLVPIGEFGTTDAVTLTLKGKQTSVALYFDGLNVRVGEGAADVR